MKNVKKVLSVAMVASMVFSMTACGKSFKAIDKKDFKKALKAIELDEDMEEIEDDNVEYLGIDDAEYAASAYDEDQMYMFIEFEDADAAKEYFEDEFYDDFEDAIEDEDIDGKYSNKISDDSGYIIVNGENDDEEMYGGIYFKDNVMVVAISYTTKKSDMKDIDAFLDAIGYPKP